MLKFKPLLNINLAIFLIVMISAAVFVRLPLFGFQTPDYYLGIGVWYDFIRENGILGAFKYTFSDYNYPYLHLLSLLTLLPVHKLVAIKVLSLIFDFVIATVAMLAVFKKYKDRVASIFAFLAVLFAPTVIINSSYWGQTDAIYTAFLVISVFLLLKNKLFLSMLFYSISFAFKLQAIFLLPLFLILLLKRKIHIKYFLLLPLVYFISGIPSLIAGKPWLEVFSIYLQQADSYPYLALNAPTLYQWLPQDQFAIFYPAGVAFAATLISIFIYLVYRKNINLTDDLVVKIAMASLLLVPFLLPKMHERYFFPADVFSIIYAFYKPKFFFIPIAMQAVSLFSYGPYLWGYMPDFPAVSLFLFIILLIVLFDLLKDLYSPAPLPEQSKA